jgi:hypothetical protein
MAVTAFAYPYLIGNAFRKELNIAAAGDTCKTALSNTAYTYAATHRYFDATPFTTAWTELSTANGYTAGGVTPGSQVITDAQTVLWTMANAVWTSSGTLSATSAVNYDGTPGAGVKPLISYVRFGGTVTAASGATLTIAWAASIVSVAVT